MKNRFIIITTIALLISYTSNAQGYTPAMLSYSQQELFTNPAYAGSQGAFSGTVNVQTQWNQFDKSPNTQRLQAHSPFFNNKVGLGLTFQHESYGVSHNYGLSAHYAYKIKTLQAGTFSLGLQAGFNTSQERLADLHTPIPDPVFSENTQLMWGFNCGIGAYYSDSLYYVGLSAPMLIDNSLKEGAAKLNNSLSFDKMPFYLTAGYVFALSPSFRLKPAGLLSYSGSYNFGYNASLTAYYQHKMWIGAIARYNNNAGGFVGLNILEYANVNYMVTFNYGDTFEKTGQGVIHEISLNVMLNLNNGKAKFRYF